MAEVRREVVDCGLPLRSPQEFRLSRRHPKADSPDCPTYQSLAIRGERDDEPQVSMPQIESSMTSIAAVRSLENQGRITHEALKLVKC